MGTCRPDRWLGSAPRSNPLTAKAGESERGARVIATLTRAPDSSNVCSCPPSGAQGNSSIKRKIFQKVLQELAEPPGSGVSMREHVRPGSVPVSSVDEGKSRPGNVSKLQTYPPEGPDFGPKVR